MERHEHASHDEAPSIGRRRFVRWLGLGGLFAGLGGALSGLAAGEARGQAAPPPATPPTPPPAAPTAPPPPSDEAKALHAALVARYGAHLDAAQREALLPAIDGTVQSANALRARKLANAIEPDTIFRAREPRRGAEGDR